MSDHNEMPAAMGKAKPSAAKARLQGVVNQEPLARKVSSILGASSAAALALADYDRRLAGGEPVIIFSIGGRWIVGPADKIAQVLETTPKRGRRAAKVVN